MVLHTLRFLGRLARHRWHEPEADRAVPHELRERLARRVAASEQRHTGEIRLCIESGLPWSYLWRDATPRERAVTMFGKLRVWDTADNNGVLIYLLLSSHAIEVVADRGLSQRVPQAEWDALVARLSQAMAAGQVEEGVTRALEEVSALLVAHFPAAPGDPRNVDELPDAPDVR